MLKIRSVAAGNRGPRQLDLRCGEAGDRLVHLPDIPVAIETRPISKREFMEMGAESALIWDLGGAFHMKPCSSMHCYRWILLERSLTRLFCAKNPEPRPETFQTANGSVQE